MPERSFLMSNYYFNLLSQAQKLYRHNRQGSYKTRERYFEAYKRFLKYVGCKYNLQKLANISGKHLSGYISYMQNIGYSAATIKTDLAAIRFRHDKIPAAKYVLPGNCEFCLERRKFSVTDRTWSAGELNRMIAECWKAGREDYAAMLILARYAGLRLHEALRIDTAAAKKAIRDGIITVKGKGGKMREIPINKSISNYFYKGKELLPANFMKAYEEHGTVEQLDIEDNEITLAGYKKRYNIWLNEKLSTFNAKIREMKLQDQVLKDNIHMEMQLREQTLKGNMEKKNIHFEEKSEVLNIYKNTAVFNSEDIGNFDFLDSTRKIYHGMTNKGPTHTPEPRRMAKCVKCGKVKNRILFKSYNADNPNMGICSECFSKSKSSNQ